MPILAKPSKPTKPATLKIEDVYEFVSVLYDLVVVVENNIREVLEQQQQALANHQLILNQQMQALTNHKLILDALHLEQQSQTTDLKAIAVKVPNVTVTVEDNQPVVLHNKTKRGT